MSFLLFLLSIIIGTQIGYIFAILIDKQISADSIFLYVLCIVIFVFVSMITIYFRQRKIYKNIQMLQNTDKDKYVLKSIQIFKTSIDSVLKFKIAFSLCNYYTEKKDYNLAKKAIDMIKQKKFGKSLIECKFISKKRKFEYYLKQIQLSTISHNIIDAYTSFLKGEKYINSYLSKQEYKLKILKILSEYEYEKGNYSQAEKYLLNAINECENEYEKDSLKIFLAKVYYKLENYQKAEFILEQIIGNNTSCENTKKAKKLLLNKII